MPEHTSLRKSHDAGIVQQDLLFKKALGTVKALNQLNCSGNDVDCKRCPISANKNKSENINENKTLWKGLMPLWVTLLAVGLIVLLFSVRYLLKGTSISILVTAFQYHDKEAEEMDSDYLELK